MNIKIKIVVLAFLVLSACQYASAQDSINIQSLKVKEKLTSIYGFIRGGLYYDLNRTNNGPYFSSGFSDFGLKVESAKQGIYKAFADIRFRLGSEFNKPVNTIDIREGYVELFGGKWDISLGQRILKWGRADFTNPTSKFNPQNQISRSPDREDMDMGNILALMNWYPTEAINIQAVLAPFYMPSILIIDPVPLPENTTINQINGMVTGQQMLSYGFRTDFHLTGVDMGISWFKGYDPMPGISLKSFSLDFSGPTPVPMTQLTVKPYKIQVFGIDYESSIGPVGLRGEAAWSLPCLSYKTNEYVPLEEIKWVAGIDWSPGTWRLTCEYTGKFLPNYELSAVNPIIGTESDNSKLSELLAVPGFNITDYVLKQVGAFNRLYNNQLEEYYHSAGLRIETNLFYDKVIPSVFGMYNFTSKDMMIIPEIRYKPMDGLTIVAGAELFNGINGSLFNIINDFMNTVYVSLKVDF